MMAHATMEVTMSIQFVLLMYCVSYFFMVWILDFKAVLSKRECGIYSFLLLGTSLLLIGRAPLFYCATAFFFCLAVKFYFYIKTFRSWLPGVLLIILKYILVVLSWFLTFDLPRIFLGMDLFNPFLWMLAFHIIQQLVLIILAFLVKAFLTKIRFIYRLYSFTFPYRKLSLCALGLVGLLSYIRQYRSYPDYTETFIFTLLVIVLLLAVSFFIIWITSEKQNQLITLQMKNQYLSSQQKTVNDLRDFKHDYKNMLIVLAEYLEQEQYQEGKQYLQEILNYSRQELDFDYYADIYKLKNIDLQNYLFTFISKCNAQQVKFSLTVKGQPRLIAVNPVKLVRIVSIISDNALEACAGKPNNFIHLFIEFTETTVTFTMKNSCSENIDLQNIMNVGYSTKPQHSGRGLAFLEKATKELGAELSIAQQKNTFTVVIHFM